MLKKHSVLLICMFSVFFLLLSASDVFAATTTIHADQFLTSFSGSNLSNAADGDNQTAATVTNPTGGVDGRFHWANTLPSNAVITQYEFDLRVESPFFKAGCTSHLYITDFPAVNALEVGQRSIVSSSGIDYFTFTVNTSSNSNVWNWANWDNQDISTATMTIGHGGGSCDSSTTRYFIDGYVTITYDAPATNDDIFDAILNLPENIANFITDIFVPDFTVVSEDIESFVSLINTKVPFAYANAIFSFNTSDIADPHTGFNVEWTWYYDTNGDPVTTSHSFDGTEGYLGIVRNGLGFLLFVILAIYVLHKARTIIP